MSKGILANIILVKLVCSTTNAFLLSPTGRTCTYGPCSSHHQRSRQQTIQRRTDVLTSKADDNDEIFYDDFAGFGYESSTEVDNTLLKLIDESKKKLGEQEARISKNWKTGNWNVRGFALDKIDPTQGNQSGENGLLHDDLTQIEFQEKMGSAPKLRRDSKSQRSQAQDSTAIEVCKIVLDEDALYDDASDIMAVGRTDGSVFLVQMGSEYLTKFRAVPRITSRGTVDGDISASVKSELVNEDVVFDKMKESVGMEDENAHRQPTSGQENAPFEILHQFRVGEYKGDAISSLLFHGTNIFTSAGVNGDIQVWDITLCLSDDTKNVSESKPLRTLTNAHSDKIVVLKTLSSSSSDGYEKDDASHHNLLFSACLDGSIALWDLKSGDLVYRCQMVDDSGNNISVTCADIDRIGSEHFLYIGLSSGHIVGYAVSALIGHASIGDTCPVPTCRFTAHQPKFENKKSTREDFCGVTSIVCGGKGSLASRGREGEAKHCKNTILVSGGADGTIKQWEMIAKKNQDSGVWSCEHWPRLSSQRMKSRSHLFQGHDGPISSLSCPVIDSSKLVSAGLDGTVRIWDPMTGKEMYRMEGFSSIVRSLCLDRERLVTDGMSEFVCVHDFDVEEDEFESGLDYLDF